MTVAPAFLNDRAAAEMIGSMSREKVRQLRLRGVLAFTQEGRNVQIPREAVEDYIEAQRLAAQEEQLRRARTAGVSDPANQPYVDMIFAGKQKRLSR